MDFFQAYTRLQKLGVCMSHRSTLRMVDSLGKDHDEVVRKWQEELKETINTEMVMTFIYQVSFKIKNVML